MKFFRKASALLLLSGSISITALGQPKTQARLVLSAETAKPGETVLAGLELRMAPGWHTYWRNPGDSGIPTSIDWQLPPGITTGAIQWPVPEKYTAADLTTYVYHDQAVLIIPLGLSADLKPGPIQLKAAVAWLECADICLPGNGQVAASLNIGPDPKPSPESSLIQSWQSKLPRKTPLPLTARLQGTGDTQTLVLQLETPTKRAELDFFPYGGEIYKILGETRLDTAAPGMVVLRKKIEKSGPSWPAKIAGLLISKPAAQAPAEAFEVELVLAKPPPGAAGAATPGAGAGAEQGSGQAPRFFLMLIFAFLGGLILNVMPCVLPVIALKILGFVNQAKEEPGRVRRLGLVYGSGILISFLILSGLVIAVQQTGRLASWGMQFQNAQFLAGMTVLVTLVALNLFGLFEVNLGGGFLGAAGNLTAREGYSGAFFNGVLATALATPCTAPFLAPALGFAFSQPSAVIVLMFVTIGMGLAAPYVILTWFPQWLRFLPKPGLWMVRFKVAMGFPMLATALWLFYLTTTHFGKNGTLWFGLFLVVLAMAVWIWGEFVQNTTARHRGLAMAISLVLVLAGYGYMLERQLHWRAPAVSTAARPALQEHPDGIPWMPWTPSALEAARAQGRPVLVDFTADWCLTCQVNKKTSLEIPAVRSKLKQINAVALLGDHTRPNAAITQELLKYERAGVPLVLVFPSDPNQAAIVLPEILTPAIVLNALDKAAGAHQTARTN